MFADVLLSLPIDRPFTYGIPPQMNVSHGMKVTAPFLGKPLPGFVLSVTETSPPFPVKPLLTAGEVLIEEPFFGLGRWMADQYACSWGETLHAMVPTGVKKATKTKMVKHLTLIKGISSDQIRGPKQRRTIEILMEAGTLTLAELTKRLGSKPDVKGLQGKNLVTVGLILLVEYFQTWQGHDAGVDALLGQDFLGAQNVMHFRARRHQHEPRAATEKVLDDGLLQTAEGIEAVAAAQLGLEVGCGQARTVGNPVSSCTPFVCRGSLAS